MTTMTIRQAGADEFDIVFELLAESVEWLRGKGLDQWSTWEKWRTKMRPSLERGDVWLLRDGDDVVGTVTVEAPGDPDFWTPSELQDAAGYVSKLAVRRSRAGAELGRLLLDWASDHMYRLGRDWLRLDAWKTNEDLHAYYRERGWTYLRTSGGDHRHSGALFQKVVAPMSRQQRSRLAEVPEIPPIDAPMKAPSDSSDPAGNWQPGHTHWSKGFTVETRWLSSRPITLVPGCRYRIRHGDGGWVLEAGEPGFPWKQSGNVTESMRHLDEGLCYVLTHDDKEPCCIRLAESEAMGI